MLKLQVASSHAHPKPGPRYNPLPSITSKPPQCPLPILRAKKALATLEAGQILSVRATDPGAPDDFAAFCRQTGHQLLASDTDNGVFVLVIQHK